MGTIQLPIEIKASGTFNPDFYKGLKYWRELTAEAPEIDTPHGYVIYNGVSPLSGREESLLVWDDLESLWQRLRQAGA